MYLLLFHLIGGLFPEEDYFQLFGEYSVECHVMVGQNGIKASSYQNQNGGRYKLFRQWKQQVPVFQEMALASGNIERQVGSLMGVMEAAVRIDADYLNVYAVDVLKGTKDIKIMIRLMNKLLSSDMKNYN